MFGIRFIKFEPSEYSLKYKNGKIVREGLGISFYYYAPSTSIVMVPVASRGCSFIFEEVTSDYQTVSVQGQLTYRIAHPRKAAELLDLTLLIRGGNRYYQSDDLQQLAARISNLIRVSAKKYLEGISLSEAVRSNEVIASHVLERLRSNEEINQLGIWVMGLSILAVQPSKETSRALEAPAREKILKVSDDALYERRNASIAQERGIKENEYNTEIAIENKRWEIRQAQLDAQQAEMRKQNELEMERLSAEIDLEEQKKILIDLVAENAKAEADAKAYELKAMMDALGDVDINVVKALAAIGMQPQALIANAFTNLAENAEKVGHLNITPDLMRELIVQ